MSLALLTRDSRSEEGEILREFDLASAATVIGAAVGALFLLFFLAAFLPWLLDRAMTSAVDGLMVQLGFGGFTTDTIWSWLLVLGAFAAFTAFIVAIAAAILWLYNLLTERTGRGFRLGGPSRMVPQQVIAPEPVNSKDDEAAFDALYSEASVLAVKGRSHMSKGELEIALRRARRSSKTRQRLGHSG